MLHPTALAVIEAERFKANRAVMIGHSFSQHDRWFAEFQLFAGLFGVEAEMEILEEVKARRGIPLHIVWVRGDKKYLRRRCRFR